MHADSSYNRTLAERCSRLELLVLDVDGVLTDGRIVYTDQGGEIKNFHVRDGLALKMWHDLGKTSAILTGRTSRIVEIRAAELGVAYVSQGVADKGHAYEALLQQTGLEQSQVACLGDDLPDLPVLRNCGLAIAVADACPELRADCHHVTRAAGGHAAAREAIEMILRCQGTWQAVVDKHRSFTLNNVRRTKD